MTVEGERPLEPEAARAIAAAPRRRLVADLTPLRHRNFRLLLTGRSVSYLGSEVTRVAVPFQVFALTRSSLAVGLVAAVQLVPILTLSLWGGAIADALDKRKVLIRADLALLAVSGLLALNALLPEPSLAAIYVLAAIGSALYCFGRPALDAAVPRLVPREELAAAAALTGITATAGGIAGPALGGVLIAAFGLPLVFALDAGTYLVGVVCGLLLDPVPPSHGAPRPSIQAILDGFRWVRTQPAMLGTYAMDGVAMVFGMPDALLPALALERFGGSATTLGLLAAAPPVGALLASALSGWTGRVRRHGLAITCAVVAWGVAITAFGLSDSLPLALGFAAVAGAADMVSGIFRMTMWNEMTPDHLRGRLAGVELASYASGPALGNVEAGIVASLTSVRFSIVSGGVLVLAGAAAVTALLPGFVRYRAGEQPAQAAADGPVIDG